MIDWILFASWLEKIGDDLFEAAREPETKSGQSELFSAAIVLLGISTAVNETMTANQSQERH